MSRRSRDAPWLAAQLRAETGVEVEVAWDSSSGSRGWRWHVDWVDGPNVATMRGHAQRLTSHLGIELDADEFAYVRIVSDCSHALAMVRNVRLGQPPLGRHVSVWPFADELEQANYPEQSTRDDTALAAALAHLGGQDPAGMLSVLERLGIAGLRAEIEPPDNVIPLHSQQRTRRPR